jgi:hypothetical protein
MPSWSDVRVPEPECPLIMPCAARKSLIFSRNIVTLLFSYGGVWSDEISGKAQARCTTASARGAYLEPLGTLLPKAKTLKAETDARFAPTLCVWPFITFLKRKIKDGE